MSFEHDIFGCIIDHALGYRILQLCEYNINENQFRLNDDVYSICLSDAICQHRNGSPLARLMCFLPEASIGPHCLRSSVRPSVRHQVCPCDNPSPVQARITKFGP